MMVPLRVLETLEETAGVSLCPPYTDPAHVEAGEVLAGAGSEWLWGGLRHRVGRAGQFKGWRGWILVATVLALMLSLLLQPDTPPAFPRTYVNKIAGVDPRRFIGDQAAYWEVSMKNVYRHAPVSAGDPFQGPPWRCGNWIPRTPSSLSPSPSPRCATITSF